jgi:hypothetical protein
MRLIPAEKAEVVKPLPVDVGPAVFFAHDGNVGVGFAQFGFEFGFANHRYRQCKVAPFKVRGRGTGPDVIAAQAVQKNNIVSFRQCAAGDEQAWSLERDHLAQLVYRARRVLQRAARIDETDVLKTVGGFLDGREIAQCFVL